MTIPARNLPTITLVTPSFNQGEFIQQTIDSVLQQNYPNLDYHVQDGGSTDATLNVLKSYGSRLSWVSEPDLGQSNAINTGWKRSHSEIVAWLNSDDVLSPGALQQAGTFFAENPEVDILYGDCDCIDLNGKFLMDYPTEPFDFSRLVLYTINYIPQPAAFLRRRVLEETGWLDEALRYVMDFDLWLRAGIMHPVAYLPVRLASLRIHPLAKSTAELEKFGNELVRIYERFFSKPDLPESIRSLKNRAMSNIYYRAADGSFSSGHLAEARRYAWRSWQFNPLRMRRMWFYLALGKLGMRLKEKRNNDASSLDP